MGLNDTVEHTKGTGNTGNMHCSKPETMEEGVLPKQEM